MDEVDTDEIPIEKSKFVETLNVDVKKKIPKVCD